MTANDRAARKGQETEANVLQLRKIGNSIGLILPRDMLARLNLSEGDKLHVVEQSERGLNLSPYDPTHARALELARKAMKRYADTFRELAK